MNQSIDKLANLLVARKAIHSLPANASITLRELNALVLDGSNAAHHQDHGISQTTHPQTASSRLVLSGVRSTGTHDHTPSLVTNNAASHHLTLEASSSSPSSTLFLATVRRLSSYQKQ